MVLVVLVVLVAGAGAGARAGLAGARGGGYEESMQPYQQKWCLESKLPRMQSGGRNLALHGCCFLKE